MGGRSESSTASKQVSKQVIDTETTNLSDFEGIGIADARDVQVSITDQGAIKAAERIVLDTVDGAFDLGERVVVASERTGARAIDLGETGLKTGANIAKVGLDTSEDFLRRGFNFGTDAFDFVEDVVNKSLNFVQSAGRDTTKTLSGAITKASEATRTDSANVLNNIVKFGGIAAAGLALVFILTRR